MPFLWIKIDAFVKSQESILNWLFGLDQTSLSVSCTRLSIMRENFLRIDTRSKCYRKNPKVPSCMSNSTVQCAVSMTAVDRSYSISTTYGAREQFQDFIKLYIVQKRISLITGKIIG